MDDEIIGFLNLGKSPLESGGSPLQALVITRIEAIDQT
jgi:hypothetical protein